MTLNPLASNLIIAWYLGLSLVLTCAVAGLTVFLYRVNARFEALTLQVEPLLQKTEATLELAHEKLTVIGTTTESLLAHTDAVAATVETRTESTAKLVQKTIHTPIVSVNALLAGVIAGASALTGRKSSHVLKSNQPQPSVLEKANHGE